MKKFSKIMKLNERKMSEVDVENFLTEALYMFAEESNKEIEVLSFREAGVMTKNKGVILKTDDGSAFQIDIVTTRSY